MTVRVYTPPGKAEEGRFSLMVATDALDLYDDFFAIPYPLPKLDMVRRVVALLCFVLCMPACLYGSTWHGVGADWDRMA